MYFAQVWTHEDTLKYGPDSEGPGGVRIYYSYPDSPDVALLHEVPECRDLDSADAALYSHGFERVSSWDTLYDAHGCMLYMAPLDTVPQVPLDTASAAG